jgi:hypothetical protein
MIRNNQSRRPGGYRGSRRSAQTLRIPHPPPFQAAYQVTKTLRFQSTAALTQATATITFQNLLDLMCVADTAVSAYRLFSSVRLNSVKIWGPPAAALAPVTVSVEFQANASASIAGPNRLKSDTSIGSTSGAFVMARPPEGSISSFWGGQTSASAVFSLTGPINSIVDINITLLLQNGEPPKLVTSAPVGAIVGTVYCRGLDALTATILPPVSYTTI